MRTLIAGPLAGGSLSVARATASAFTSLGYQSTFIDYSPFADQFQTAMASVDDRCKRAFVEAVEKVLVDQVHKDKPDILLGIAQSPLFNNRLMEDLRKLGVITLYWLVEDFRILTYWKRIAPFFDIFFSIQTGAFVKALADAGANNHYYLPVAFDNNLGEPPVQSGARTPISFMGAPYPNRVRVFGALAPYNLKIYGEGWDSHPVPGVTAGSRWINESEVRAVYRNTEINLNLHSSMNPYAIGGDFVNPRTFELAGMGCFQLSDRRELLPALYSEDEVVQFGNEAELIEKIEYYMEHEGERKEAARKARRKTLNRHLYEHRVIEIMNAVQRLSR
jgi:spore maturation protein CgeB